MISQSIAAYQHIDATTANPVRLVLLLMDGAISRLGQALRALERHDHVSFAAAIGSANGILGELAGSLDRDKGKEIAANLDAIYGFVLRRLTQALLTRSPRHIEEAATTLITVRDGFQGAMDSWH